MRSATQLKNFDMGSHFILTRPHKISDIVRSDMPYSTDHIWQERARQLQVRRWRKIKHDEEA